MPSDLSRYIRIKGEPSPCSRPEGLRQNLVTGQRIGLEPGYSGWVALSTWRGRGRVFAVIANQAYSFRQTKGFRSLQESSWGIRYSANCVCNESLVSQFSGGYITFLNVNRTNLNYFKKEPDDGSSYDFSNTDSLTIGVSYESEGSFTSSEGFRFEVISSNLLRDTSGTFDNNWKPTILLGEPEEIAQYVAARSGQWGGSDTYDTLIDAYRYAPEGVDPYSYTCAQLGLQKQFDGLFGDICLAPGSFDNRDHYGLQLLLTWPQRSADAYWCGGLWGGETTYQNPCQDLVPAQLQTCQALGLSGPSIRWVRKDSEDVGSPSVGALVGVAGTDLYDRVLERPPEYAGARLESVEFSIGDVCPDGWMDCGDCCINCCNIANLVLSKVSAR